MSKRIYAVIQRGWPDLLRLLGFALCYAVLGKLVLTFFAAPGNLSMVWPPSGLALAVLLLGGRRYWPGVFLGTIGASLSAGLLPALAVFFALGNTLETLVGYWFLTRLADFRLDLPRSRDFLQLFWVATVGAGVAAVIGASTLLLSGQASAQMIFVVLLQWWQSELLGVMLLTPLILVWRRWPGRSDLGVERAIEAAISLLLAFLCGQIVFLGRRLAGFVGRHRPLDHLLEVLQPLLDLGLFGREFDIGLVILGLHVDHVARHHVDAHALEGVVQALVPTMISG